MMEIPRLIRSLRNLPVALFVLLPLLPLAGCGQEQQQDPQAFYRSLVEAARKQDGAFMYDVLDSSRRSEVDTLIGMQMANLSQIPPEERGRWEALKGKPKREVYSKILAADQGIAALFTGEYNVLRADTLVALTVQHEGQPANVIYLRPRNGSYVVAKPPRPPGAPMNAPAQAPPAQGSQGRTMPPGGASPSRQTPAGAQTPKPGTAGTVGGNTAGRGTPEARDVPARKADPKR